MALDFTLLTREQILGDKNGAGQLDVMKRYGTGVAPTDLAVLLGGFMTGSDSHTSEGDPTCITWSASPATNGGVCCFGWTGSTVSLRPNGGGVASVRPALPPWETSKISPSKVKTIKGIRVAEYGEYPQTIADEQTSKELERRRESRSLRPTGKDYTFDSVGLDDYGIPFKATSYPEYELDGKRYIRVLGRAFENARYLSTGKQVENGKPYWVQVQPIEWLTDESGWMVSKKCLFAGIRFDMEKEYDGKFSQTFMKHYLDAHFTQEVISYELEKQRRDKVLKGLSARLEAMTNAETIDAIREKLKAAEKGRKTPTEAKRMEEAARIKQVRQARDVILTTLQKAAEGDDKKLVQEILNLDIVRYYDSRYQIQQEKSQQRRAVRRAQRKQADRG